jgi:hypothetical protein
MTFLENVECVVGDLYDARMIHDTGYGMNKMNGCKL